MKSVFCRVRDYEDGNLIPTNKGYIEIKPNVTLRCRQPDALDREEFNLVIFIGREQYRAPSIDFEFYNTRAESEAEIKRLIERGEL